MTDEFVSVTYPAGDSRLPPACPEERRGTFGVRGGAGDVKLRGLAALLVIVAMVAAACEPAAPTGSFIPAGLMVIARSGDTATLLQDGRVLMVGGQDSAHGSLASAELYDRRPGSVAPDR